MNMQDNPNFEAEGGCKRRARCVLRKDLDQIYPKPPCSLCVPPLGSEESTPKFVPGCVLYTAWRVLHGTITDVPVYCCTVFAGWMSATIQDRDSVELQ